MRAVFLLALFSLTGCIAGKAGYYLVDTEKAYKAAEESGAEELAVYEFTLAKAYRAKAWEEMGYSAYGPAEAYAIQATEYALRAAQIARNERPDRSLIEEIESDQGALPELVDRPQEPEVEVPSDEPLPTLEEESDEELDWLFDELEGGD